MRFALVVLAVVLSVSANAGIKKEEALERVVVELEYLHKLTREVSAYGRVDKEKSFPYSEVLLEVSEIRLAILRHMKKPDIRRPEAALSPRELPEDISLTMAEKDGLRSLLNQVDSVIDMLPAKGERNLQKERVRFNFQALETDLRQLRRYLLNAILRSDNLAPMIRAESVSDGV